MKKYETMHNPRNKTHSNIFHNPKCFWLNMTKLTKLFYNNSKKSKYTMDINAHVLTNVFATSGFID